MKLKELADKFLNHSVINASGKQYRICEIEFYIYSAEHPDEYTHKAPEQKMMNKWYFHKKGKSYKGLSDKYLEYKSRKYRFLIFPEVIKKQKSDLTPI